MEQKPKIPTNKESLSINSVVLTKDALIQEIYQGESFPSDNRFLHKEKGGVFHYFDIDELSFPRKEKERIVYPVIKKDSIIVAIAELEKDPHNTSLLWLKNIDVDYHYQGQGFSRLLLEKIFDYVKEQSCDLHVSSYSSDGLKKIAPIIKELAEKTGIIVTEGNQRHM